MPLLNVTGYGDLAFVSGEDATEQLGDFARAYSGKARTDYTGTTKVWRFTSGYLTLAAAATLRGVLLGAAAFNASGDMIGATVPVFGRNVRTQFGPGADDATVQFELHQVTPS